MSKASKATKTKGRKGNFKATIEAPHAVGADKVFEALHSGTSGLISEEVVNRQKEGGKNEFTKEKKRTVYGQIWEQVRSPLAFVLIVAFVVTFALEEFVDAFTFTKFESFMFSVTKYLFCR